MNQAERNQCAKLLANLAVYYSRPMTKEVLDMMVDDLDGLSLMQIERGILGYRRDPKNRTFPLPAQIRAISEPSLDPDSAARELAARVTGAVTKFGYPWPEEARAFIGEVGWGVVGKLGGWSYICENLGTHIDTSMFQAQLRELGKVALMYEPAAVERRLGIATGATPQTALLTSQDEKP